MYDMLECLLAKIMLIRNEGHLLYPLSLLSQSSIDAKNGGTFLQYKNPPN